jgi:hypothetical protein
MRISRAGPPNLTLGEVAGPGAACGAGVFAETLPRG